MKVLLEKEHRHCEDLPIAGGHNVTDSINDLKHLISPPPSSAKESWVGSEVSTAEYSHTDTVSDTPEDPMIDASSGKGPSSYSKSFSKNFDLLMRSQKRNIHLGFLAPYCFMSIFVFLCVVRALSLINVLRRELDLSKEKVTKLYGVYKRKKKDLSNPDVELRTSTFIKSCLEPRHRSSEGKSQQLLEKTLQHASKMLSDKSVDVFEVLLTSSINISLNIAKDTILMEFHHTVKCILQLPYILVASVLFSPVTFILDAGYFNGHLHTADITLVAVCYEIVLVLYSLVIIRTEQGTNEHGHEYFETVVLSFLFFLQVPVVWICAFHLPQDTQATTIHEPSRIVRNTLQNINAMISILLEAWTLNSLCFQLATHHPDSVKAAFVVFLFDFGPHLWSVSVGAAIMISFLFSFFISVLSSNKGLVKAPGEFAQLITASLPIFTGPLFMCTISELLGVLDCTSLKDEDTGERTLYLDASLTYRGYEPDLSLSDDKIRCFTSPHKELTALALLAAVLFFPCATLSPYGSLPAFTHPNLDIKTVPIFTIIERLIKVNAMVFSTLYSTMPHIFLPVLLVSNTTLLLCNEVFVPCCIPFINHLKTSLYAFSIWTVLVTWAAEFALDFSLGGESRSDFKWYVFLSVLVGFLGIFGIRNGQDFFKLILRHKAASNTGKTNSQTKAITVVDNRLEECIDVDGNRRKECIERLANCKQMLAGLENSKSETVHESVSRFQWNKLWKERGELRKSIQFSPVRTRIYIEKSLFELAELVAVAGQDESSNCQVEYYLLMIVSAGKMDDVNYHRNGVGKESNADDKPNFHDKLEATHETDFFCQLFGLKLLQANVLKFLADCLLPDLDLTNLETTHVNGHGFIAWDEDSKYSKFKSTRLAVQALLFLLKHNTNRLKHKEEIAWREELDGLGITYDQRIMRFENHIILRKLMCCLASPSIKMMTVFV
eukprot:gene9270-10981_t